MPAYELFSSTDLLGEIAVARVLAGLSTRRYGLGLEPVGAAVEQTSKGTTEVVGVPPVRVSMAGRSRSCSTADGLEVVVADLVEVTV